MNVLISMALRVTMSSTLVRPCQPGSSIHRSPPSIVSLAHSMVRSGSRLGRAGRERQGRHLERRKEAGRLRDGCSCF